MTRNVTKFPLWMLYLGLIGLGALFPVVCLPGPSYAEGDDSFICDQISSVVSDQTGVPVSVLKAISLTETGRKRGGKTRPWPWTVNMEGKGVWFETEDEAKSFVFKHFKRGARSFDVGCFQINYKWHHQNFSSLEEMFDPLASGLYAASFLRELYDEKGNWDDAAGAYHSRTQKYAEKYKARFSRFRAQLSDQNEEPVLLANTSPNAPHPKAENDDPRINSFPLLQTGLGQKGMGSLVPMGGVSATPFFARESG